VGGVKAGSSLRKDRVKIPQWGMEVIREIPWIDLLRARSRDLIPIGGMGIAVSRAPRGEHPKDFSSKEVTMKRFTIPRVAHCDEGHPRPVLGMT